MNDCDESRDGNKALTNDKLCDYATLWAELDGLNKSIPMVKKYTEKSKDGNGAYNYAKNNLTTIKGN